MKGVFLVTRIRKKQTGAQRAGAQAASTEAEFLGIYWLTRP